MNEFSATLDEFFSGRCEFAQLESTLARLLRVEPTLAAQVQAELERHFGAGRLPAQLYAALERQLVPADDRTRLKPAAPRAPSQRDGPDSAPRSGARTGSTWSDPATWHDGASESIGPGSSLKGRFVLEEEVGRGGMGVVFRARDLRKEEAQDRDPFVAIKILNDDFRRHPESLKALQREARKAQTLAHPNIATVFDFDRDGSIVYIQMEFLDGEPLDKLTKRTGGLGYRAAYPLIAGAGRALSYAHGKGIVHSDFKPGNCFVTKGNVVKVFDFGIARAAKVPGLTNDDLTRFDAGTLGALTPAYASCEMLEGEEPDARDDIYALGCVAYELLTGRHPFDKRKATEARDAKLNVAPVKDLTQRQFRALQKALAFRREQRTPSVAEFLEQLGERKVNKAVLLSALAAAGAITIAGVAVLPGYLENRRVGELVEAFGSNDEARVAAAIDEYTRLEPNLRVLVLESSRDPLIEHFRGIVAAAVNPSQGRYDYPRAEAALRTAQTLIPDSAILSGLMSALESDKAELMLRMRTEFTEHLAAGRLLPGAGPEDDVYDVLRIVAAASPNDPLLDDPQLVHAYALQTAAALDRGDLDAARALLDRGRERAPDDAPLRDLEDRLAATLEAQTSVAVAANAPAAPEGPAAQRAALAELLAAPRFDAGWETAARDLLAGLASSLPPEDTTVSSAQGEIAELYTARAREMRGRERLSEADRLLNVARSFAPGLASLAAERTALDAARERAAAAAAERARAAQLEGRQQTFLAAATANQLARARETLAALRAELPAGDPFLTTAAPAALAAMHERLARTALAESRLADAEALATEGLENAPGNAALGSLLTEIRAAAASAARPVGQPCSAELAGFGARGSRGQCWDMVDASTQAPRLVVVPAGGELGAAFAIGRFETAVGQWNAYCRATDECTPRDGNDTDPLTGVSIDEARRYTAWLSARTGARYRLPTAAEWQHAAGAPRDARNDDNCVVAAAGRGGIPRAVTQGQQNNWGLLNYQGNVQEWTDSGGTIEARGGSYRDPLEACTAAATNVHGGTADDVTGFRIVREL